MRRKLFFFMERLQVRPQEVRAISLCLLIAIAGFRVAPALQDRANRSTFDYREQDRIFLERTAEARKSYEEWTEKLKLAEEGRLSGKLAPVRTERRDSTRSEGSGSVGESRPERLVLNLNQATEEELQLLPGIGPAYARRIVAWREHHGAYQSIDQLIEIRGIGEKRLERLRPHLRVPVADQDSL